MPVVYILAVLAALSLPALAGAEVFKCVVDGKVVYKAQAGEGCEQKELRVIPSDPKELERVSAERARQAEADRQLEEQKAREREARAREAEIADTRRITSMLKQQTALQQQQLKEMERANQPIIIQDPFQEENQAKDPSRRYFQPLESK